MIYDATGSHANYTGRALYLGRGAREGFGCDDTRKATTPVPLQTVLLPEIPTSRSAPFAWLAFYGRWDQKERHQQRPDGAGSEAAVVGADRVGGRPA